MPERPEALGARNPYALAEVVLNRPIDWSTVEDPRSLLEEVLQTPYEQLFDPKFGGPLYLGAVLRDGMIAPVEPRRPAEPTTPEQVDHHLPDDIDRLRDLESLLGDLGEVQVRRIAPSRAGGWTLEVAAGGARGRELHDAVFNESVLDRLTPYFPSLDWTPAGGAWADLGDMFEEAAEFLDPIQGALADCWLIAAMSSVAWALPGALPDRPRATGHADSEFTHLLSYRDPGTGAMRAFEVTDDVVVFKGSASPMYGRSSEPGEIWPGLIEKAFAQWRLGTTAERPRMPVLDYGDCVWASAALSGRSPHYVGHAGQSAASLIQLVKSHCRSYRSVDPMTAWTYPTAPAGLSYSNSTIVANHCYSVLGWTTGTLLRQSAEHLLAGPLNRNRDRITRTTVEQGLDLGKLQIDYVVLRNPWGVDPTLDDLRGVIRMRDVDFWRWIDLDSADGVFAIDFDTYQKYFEGTGVAV